ncbi:beta-glucan synthesis-associated [Mucidula mucida]|nr:beta-glucan synthesis-associated [Mucidula mucida]
MGNLGRAVYGANLDGTWPYTYNSYNVGAVLNQTFEGSPLMVNSLSFLPGQKLSRCTCPGESHPGPMHADGTFVGQVVPEINVFEAQVVGNNAHPFNYAYKWLNDTDNNLEIYNSTVSQLNLYRGGVYPQSTSASLAFHGCLINSIAVDPDCYELEGGCYSVYAFKYKPGYDDGYITWVNDGKGAWTFRGPGTAADSRVEIGARPVPQEPMYIITNLGMSGNFGDTIGPPLITYTSAKLPAPMRSLRGRRTRKFLC